MFSGIQRGSRIQMATMTPRPPERTSGIATLCFVSIGFYARSCARVCACVCMRGARLLRLDPPLPVTIGHHWVCSDTCLIIEPKNLQMIRAFNHSVLSRPAAHRMSSHIASLCSVQRVHQSTLMQPFVDRMWLSVWALDMPDHLSAFVQVCWTRSIESTQYTWWIYFSGAKSTRGVTWARTRRWWTTCGWRRIT